MHRWMKCRSAGHHWTDNTQYCLHKSKDHSEGTRRKGGVRCNFLRRKRRLWCKVRRDLWLVMRHNRLVYKSLSQAQELSSSQLLHVRKCHSPLKHMSVVPVADPSFAVHVDPPPVQNPLAHRTSAGQIQSPVQAAPIATGVVDVH